MKVTITKTVMVFEQADPARQAMRKRMAFLQQEMDAIEEAFKLSPDAPGTLFAVAMFPNLADEYEEIASRFDRSYR